MLETLIRNPRALILGGLLIALGGIVGFRAMPVDLFPNLNYPLINIITHDPAGTAEDIEQLVTRPIETVMLGLNDVKRVRSISAPGFSRVTVEFTWGIDVMQARQIVYARLGQITSTLPAGARPQLENVGTSLAMLSTYAVTGGNPLAVRRWVQYELAPRLNALPGVARVPVMGGGELAWRVDLNPMTLLNHHLSLAAIADAIKANHVLDTGGYLERHGRDLLIRTEGRLLSLADLRGIAVADGPDGTPIRLGDVARVYEGATPQRYVVTANRLPAVVFSIQKQPGASTLKVSGAVDRLLAGTMLPAGTSVQKFYDQAEIIGLAYRNMRNNLILGTILAVLAVVMVLGRNLSSLVIAVTFPLAVIGTFLVMPGLGLGINLMTLGALTVAIGLINDDAIVVLENIDRHKTMGKPALRAALDGTREILAPDVAGTLTVLAAFAPLVLVTGLAGRLFQPFGLTFSLVLAFSLLLSLTLIPLAAARWLRPDPPRPGEKSGETLGGRWIEWVGGWNGRLLEKLLRHRVWTVIGVVFLLISSAVLLAFSQARLLPLLDEDSLLLGYQLARGTSLKESNRIGDALEKSLLAMPEVRAVFRRTGSPGASLYIEGPDQGELVLRLDRATGVDSLAVKAKVDRLIAAMPGVIGRVNEPTTEKLDESFSGLPALFGITVLSNDLATLYRATAKIEAAARKTKGITNVVNNTKIAVDQIRVAVRRDDAARLGVTPAAIAATVRQAFQGETVVETVINQKPIDVFIRYGVPQRRTLDDISDLLVPGRRGQPIRLDLVADIERLASYPFIEHQYGLRSLTLTAEVSGNPLSTIARLDRAIKALALPASIQVAYTGEYKRLFKTATQIGWTLLAAVVLVYGIITIQLGNLIDPLVVLTKLPMDFMGAALALALTRQQLDLTVLIGFVTLVGVATNNAIMLLTFTRDFRTRGLTAEEAVKAAVKLRMRPMLLSHMTTLLALVPAALGLGHGPQLLQPLAIMLFGGLTAGTLLTLNVLPVIYVLTEGWRTGSPTSR